MTRDLFSPPGFWVTLLGVRRVRLRIRLHPGRLPTAGFVQMRRQHPKISAIRDFSLTRRKSKI